MIKGLRPGYGLGHGNCPDQVQAVGTRADHVAAEMDAIANLHSVRISICCKVDWEKVHIDPGVRSNDTVLAVPLNDFAPHFSNL